MMELDKNEQMRLAFHESGHAVVQYLRGWKLQFIGIGRIAEPGQSWTGGTNTKKTEGTDGAVIAFAGPVAETRHLRIPTNDEELLAGMKPPCIFDDGGWEADLEMAARFAGNDLATYLQAAKELINRPEVWSAVSALAAGLCDPAKLVETTLREMQPERRRAILPGFETPNHDHRKAAYCVFDGDEACQIIAANMTFLDAIN